jgi:hypothetical protein
MGGIRCILDVDEGGVGRKGKEEGGMYKEIREMR